MPRGKVTSSTTHAILARHAEGLTVPAIAAELECKEARVYNAIHGRGKSVNRIARRDYRATAPGITDLVRTDYRPAGDCWCAEQSYADGAGRVLFRHSSRAWLTRARAEHAVAVGVVRWSRWRAY